MIVTSRISIDMTRANPDARIGAVQGDGNTRAVEITLLSGGLPWEIPEDASAAVAYRLPGGHRGLYDKLADGTPAVAVSGSSATITLASQMLAEAGTVQASLVFRDALENRLSSFPFAIRVAEDGGKGQKSEDFIRLQWLEDKLDEYLEREAASGKYKGDPGFSAYEVAAANGFSGSEADWLAGLKGQPGEKGDRGDTGKSAYAYAQEAGFTGTEAQFAQNLLNNGKSAYEYACEGGYTGTPEEFAAKLAAEYAPTGHSHDESYAPIAHNHDGSYAPGNHNHDGSYAPANHNHDTAYAPVAHNHDDTYLPKAGGSVTGNLTMDGGFLVLKEGVSFGTEAQRPDAASMPDGAVYLRIME